MQYNDMFWRIFEKSGSLDAYLGYIEAVSTDKNPMDEANARLRGGK